MMSSRILLAFLFILVLDTFVEGKRPRHGSRSKSSGSSSQDKESGYRDMLYDTMRARIRSLEERVDKLEKSPVQIYIDGTKTNIGDVNKDGTHVYLHTVKPPAPKEDIYSYAVCRLRPHHQSDAEGDIRGTIYLRQRPSSDLLEYHAMNFTGFPEAGEYEFRLHRFAESDGKCPKLQLGYHSKNCMVVKVDRANSFSNNQGLLRNVSLFGENSIVGQHLAIYRKTRFRAKFNSDLPVACCTIGWSMAYE